MQKWFLFGVFIAMLVIVFGGTGVMAMQGSWQAIASGQGVNWQAFNLRSYRLPDLETVAVALVFGTVGGLTWALMGYLRHATRSMFARPHRPHTLFTPYYEQRR